MPLRERFGPTIGRLRSAKRLSQAKLADRSTLHANFVGQVERGEKSVTLDTLESLARGLDITPWDLVRLAVTGPSAPAEAQRPDNGPTAVKESAPPPTQESSARQRRLINFPIVVERTDAGYFAYSPDLPGCTATGSGRDAAELAIRDAIASHLRALRAAGQPVPEPTSYVTLVEVTM